MFSFVGLNEVSLEVCAIGTVSASNRREKDGDTDLLEDIMEKSVIVTAIVHERNGYELKSVGHLR